MVERSAYKGIQHERPRGSQDNHRMGDYSRLCSRYPKNWSKKIHTRPFRIQKMTLCYPTILPVKASSTLLLNQASDQQQADLTVYQCLIGNLMYLSCGTRPDNAFVVRQLSCHNADPQIGHLYITKQVLRYLKGTITLGIKWGNNPAGHRSREKYKKLEVIGYTDSSYAGNLEDKKLITRYCFFFGRAIVTWYSKRQRIVSTSILEAKYVAMSQGAKEGV